MLRFWEHGYGASSVRDLGTAMGIGPASLYNAFGDKRALFTHCLDRYLDGTMRRRIARFEREQPPRRAIEGFFAESLAMSLSDRRGCLLINTALEIAPHDEEIGAIVADRLAELEAFFHRCAAAGQRDGSIAAAHPPADLARLFLTTLIGLRVLARARPDPALLQGAIRQALRLLDPPAPEIAS